jgi:uncharacterized LabA/DUF88 family protein
VRLEELGKVMPHPANQAVPTAPRYLYVDGASLRGRLQNISDKFFGGIAFDVDFQKLKGGFTKVFYYDAIPVRETTETEERYEARTRNIRAVFDAAASTNGVHVYEGDARRRRRRGLEQKTVDVKLTVDMLSHTFRRNMLAATLLTGDADFKPLVDALVEMGMFVTLWYPQDETNDELIKSADTRVMLGWYDLQSVLTAQSQPRFILPQPAHSRPSEPRGNLLFNWNRDGHDLGLYVQPDNEFLVTREDDPQNTLRMHHGNFELLRQCCLEARNIEIPEAGVTAAMQYQRP